MNKKTKWVLVGGLMGLVWGIILILPTILLLPECRGRNFFDIIYENFILRVLERPTLGFISILTAPALISMAITCSLPYGEHPNISLVYLLAIVLTLILSILFGVIGSSVVARLCAISNRTER